MSEKELNSVKVEITIDGKECDFSTLNLHQTLFGHHIFSIEVNYRAKEQDVWAQTPGPILEQLGKEVSIRIGDREGNTTEFEGLVKKVNLGGKSSNQGVVTIYGGSPTLLMTDDYSMATFVETDLASIVHETITNLGLNIQHQIEPVNNKEISFVYRCKESSYDFLRRLTTACGESFYYDGKKVVVGSAQAQGGDEEDISLNFKDDLIEMEIGATLGNYDIEQYDYDPVGDQIAQFPCPNGQNLDTFTTPMFRKSQSIYKELTILPSRIPVCSMATRPMMTNTVYAEHFGKLSDGSMFTARTNTCKAALGKVVFVETDVYSNLSKYDRKLGRFRVIEVNHTYDNNKKSYENKIVGINALVDFIPNRDVKWPVAQPEVATVVDNKDPKNLGRVKVRYVWQQLEDRPQGKTSGWMRVQTPDAGSSDAVAQNRGFFFVPEIGDQVMIGYELGTPDRPFVMGSLFHKNNAAGIAGENDIKSIQTRSGIKIILNDAEKSVHIEDPSGNTWDMDGNGNISVNAPETMTFNAKNINIAAQKDIQISSGENLSQTVGKNFDQSVSGTSKVSVDKTLDVIVAEKVTVDMGDSFTQNISGDMTQNAETIKIAAQKGEAKINAKGELTLKSSAKVTIAQ